MKAKFKSGAASFYVVAFSTLILTIIAASFATAIVAEITRTANDDLSQSAYDAALAGVEDAKLAFMNYQNCIRNGATISETYRPAEGSTEITCADIIYWMEHPDCDMVAHILGRMSADEGGEVLIEETTEGSNEMNQAYTCAMINTHLSDYRVTLSSSNPYKVIKVNLEDVAASEIQSVRVSWYQGNDSIQMNYSNVMGTNVAFRSLTSTKTATPPTLALQLLQTAESFSLANLNGSSDGDTTDKATVYLVPTDNEDMAEVSGESYTGAYDGNNNILSASQLARTNDQHKDLPYVVYCQPDSTNEFACSAMLNLPQPINGARSNDTFMFVISLPYGQPDTDVSLEFFCASNNPCGREDIEPNDRGEYQNNNSANLKGRISIDSTGRANDLYRRVEVVLESSEDTNTNALSLYAIQAFGDKGKTAIDKSKVVTKEWGL